MFPTEKQPLDQLPKATSACELIVDFKSGDRALTFKLHGPLVTNFNLAAGYEDPVAVACGCGREQHNYKTLQTILQDVASAISGLWKVVGKTGSVTAPDNAESYPQRRSLPV
jgi:hypothetical protein